MEVLSDVAWLSGREGYRSSSASCWDRRFGYGQRRRCGVPHFITNGFGAGARSHVVRNLLSEECGGHGRSVSRKRWWMQGQVPVGKGAVEETVDIKAWWLILYLLPVSVSPGEAAPVVFWSGCRECLLSWMRSCGRSPSMMTVVET